MVVVPLLPSHPLCWFLTARPRVDDGAERGHAHRDGAGGDGNYHCRRRQVHCVRQLRKGRAEHQGVPRQEVWADVACLRWRGGRSLCCRVGVRDDATSPHTACPQGFGFDITYNLRNMIYVYYGEKLGILVFKM